ncbi:DNA (cytosine-5)-methyltransferase 3-like [Ursus maritimus]|uniref:DNA (Cytosine-5)-methyltransferase 3-like n=1 Tax=Ursus maritimus TaxID=29073 RepID=A0A8M1F6V1_URSMA|nr:DNA (cytosine-5)-methyltransferase 3-like [Ursus maritimus]
MALSPTGTLSVETLDRSDPDPLDEGPWQATCEILLEPDEEHSTDVILVGSSDLSAPASPGPRRDLAYEVKVNQRDIEVCVCLRRPDSWCAWDTSDVCICCGSLRVHTQHPLFEGGMCAPCKDKFLDCLFLYDDDGYQSYCSICCAGETLLICENPDCTRCYCFECVDTLVGPGTSGKAQALSNWVCFLCLPFPRSGLLQRRRKWRGCLKAFCDRESENPLETYKTVPVWKREPVRVLSLFGDIRRELVSLGFLENGSAPGRLKHLDDVTDVVRRDVEGWGPFDLVYGSTPPIGHACDHPPGALHGQMRGRTRTVWYLFQFHRILQYARPRPGSRQPFFWMFVDNLLLSQDDQTAATRFLESSVPGPGAPLSGRLPHAHSRKTPGGWTLSPSPSYLVTSGRLYAKTSKSGEAAGLCSWLSPRSPRLRNPAAAGPPGVLGRPCDHPGRLWPGRPERSARVEQHPSCEKQALRPGFLRGTVAAGSGQAENKAPRPGPSPAGEELFSPPARIFQVFFNRTHFLSINDLFYYEDERLFLEPGNFPYIVSFFLSKLLFYLLDFGFPKVATDASSLWVW